MSAHWLRSGTPVNGSRALVIWGSVGGNNGVPVLGAAQDVIAHALENPAELTVHTPDLDDVFLTLTGN